MGICLVSMRYKAIFSVSPIPNYYSGILDTASGTARSRSRPGQQNDTSLLLYDPAGDTQTFSHFGSLMRRSFIIHGSVTNQDTEAGRVSPQTPPRRPGTWREFILTLIRQAFSYLQMQLPSMYFLRVAAIIRESGVPMADFVSFQQSDAQGAFMSMTQLVGTPGMPNINNIHYKRFKKKWKAFVKRCMEEWRNLNIISALLLR